MDSSRCLMLQRGSSATGGSMTTSRLFFEMFSTGCQSHSASSTSSVYSSFNHYTELLQNICEIAALQLIPPRPGCDCDHSIDGVFSTVRSLSCGVHQGSVLGPLLFLLYTADLGELAAS